MWIYIVLAIFLIALQLALMIWGGWLPNLLFGIIMLAVAVEYYGLISEGLPLGYLIPFIMVIFTILMWLSALVSNT